MDTTSFIFILLLFSIAFLYSSVGHGGASGYLALMAIFSFTSTIMKPTALVLNIFVSAIAFFQFYRGKHFQWKIFFPLAITSIPSAFLGGLMLIDGNMYKQILGILLLLPISRFIFFDKSKVKENNPYSNSLLLIIGAVIGLLSGMIGIGGGIILAPLLLLFRWTDQKQTAAICALFILVNSASGLAGQISKGISFTPEMFTYVFVAGLGGTLGAYYGSLRFNQRVLKHILASVLIIACAKLLLI